MDSTPLVSIIIPVYNVENWIEKSLKSALNQTYSNIEYIIVDDCGSDKSMNVVQSMIQSNPQKIIRIIQHDKNKGLSEARNSGLSASKGSYVFFMDSDDEISEDCIELHLSALQNSDADFSDGNVRMVGVGHNNFHVYNSEHSFEKEDILIEYFNSLHVCGWNKLIKRSFLLDNNISFRPGMLYEDMLWTYQVCKNAKRYVTIPSDTYYYLIRQGSITTQNKDSAHAIKQFNSFVELLQCMREEFQVPSNKELMRLQSRWFNKILLVIKTRLLDAPLSRNDKKFIFRELMAFSDFAVGPIKYIHKLPFDAFTILFTIPNKIFRKIR